MSRSRSDRQSKKGFDKCICGHYMPCPNLDSLWELHLERGRKFERARRLEAPHERELDDD